MEIDCFILIADKVKS